jgi:hypothetical protein
MPNTPLPRFQLDLRWYDAVATRASRRRYDGRPSLPEAAKRPRGGWTPAGSPEASVRTRSRPMSTWRMASARLRFTPVGYGTSSVPGGERLLNAVVRPRARLELRRIAQGAESWPEWARRAAEAVRLAPSGQNRQPWRLHMDETGLVLGCTTERPYWTAQIDCGAAALHLELGALHAGLPGSWDRLPEPEIARFVPSES